jgi:hypothetical protein
VSAAEHQCPGDSISIERNPNPAFPAPDDAARPAETVGLNDQGEPVRNEERGDDLKGSAGVRDIADRAVNDAAAEADRARLKHTAPPCYSVFVAHRLSSLRSKSDSSTSQGAIHRLVSVSHCGQR